MGVQQEAAVEVGSAGLPGDHAGFGPDPFLVG